MKKIVYAPGVFDILHVGHIKYLQKAKKQGDYLVVGLQSDEGVLSQKGRYPTLSQDIRKKTLEALECVDKINIYEDYNYVQHAQCANASVFCLSSQYRNAPRFEDLKKYLNSINGKIFYIEPYKGISDTMIKDKVIDTWKPIWERIASSEKNDIEVNGGYNNQGEENAKKLAKYLTSEFNIKPTDRVLDYGCGSGIILKWIDCQQYGIDISPSMIERAINNCPMGFFAVGDTITIKGYYNYIICHGTVQYFPNLKYACKLFSQMKNYSDNIIICDIPDEEKKEQREQYRRERGVNEYPSHLYYSKEFFHYLGFSTFDNKLSITNNKNYGFYAVWSRK